MGSEYERELKRLLEGDLASLVKMKKTCSAAEGEGYGMMERYPFMVVRGAGSFGVDLVALRGEFAFPIEVKSSTYDKVYLSQPRLKEQLGSFLEECVRANTFPLYAYRFKGYRGDPWRVFTLPMGDLKYFTKTLNDKVNKMGETRGGNFVMKWDEGMPLSKFLMETSRMIMAIHGEI